MVANRLAKSTDLAYLVLKNYKRNHFTFVEIGVYDGYNASIVGQEAKKKQLYAKYVGFDFFDDTNKVDLSKTNPGVHQELQVNPEAIAKLKTAVIYEKINIYYQSTTLIKGNTRDTLLANLSVIRNADLYYIDGGHTYADVKRDYTYVMSVAGLNSVVVLDDPHVPGIAQFINELKKNGTKFGSILGSVYIQR